MSISAVILAGGRATRMGCIDKGLVPFNQKPLIAHVIARLAPQVDEIFINANRETDAYKAFGYPVLQDEITGFAGPLAGMQLGLTHAKHDYLLTVPCDTPLLPLNLAKQLETALIQHNAEIAVATSDGNTHPVFCLCKISVLPCLNDFLQQGGRKVSDWQKSLKYVNVDFSDSDEAFTNLNTPEDIAKLEAKLNHA